MLQPPEDASPEEKETRSRLIQTLVAAIASAAGADGSDLPGIIAGAQAEVDNNDNVETAAGTVRTCGPGQGESCSEGAITVADYKDQPEDSTAKKLYNLTKSALNMSGDQLTTEQEYLIAQAISLQVFSKVSLTVFKNDSSMVPLLSTAVAQLDNIKAHHPETYRRILDVVGGDETAALYILALNNEYSGDGGAAQDDVNSRQWELDNATRESAAFLNGGIDQIAEDGIEFLQAIKEATEDPDGTIKKAKEIIDYIINNPEKVKDQLRLRIH